MALHNAVWRTSSTISALLSVQIRSMQVIDTATKVILSVTRTPCCRDRCLRAIRPLVSQVSRSTADKERKQVPGPDNPQQRLRVVCQFLRLPVAGGFVEHPQVCISSQPVYPKRYALSNSCPSRSVHGSQTISLRCLSMCRYAVVSTGCSHMSY
jgi:hypothetical protein